MILLNWLFQDEIFLETILSNISDIISRRDDRYVVLGWCFLGRSLIEYENVVSDVTTNETQHFSIEDTECIAALMIKRALSKFEYEDVRKLAAELCGRLHSEVLIPVLSSHLESAVTAKDLLKIKVCLFSLCTCLMVRGSVAHRHPDLLRIRKAIEIVLSWAPVDGDGTSKAQHGCIDSLALMLCVELQAPESPKGTVI